MLEEAGISLQVLSLAGPGADLLPPREGAAWAREANDALAGLVSAHPDSFAGLAHLPLTDPDADELERRVNRLEFKGALVQGSTRCVWYRRPRPSRSHFICSTGQRSWLCAILAG